MITLAGCGDSFINRCLPEKKYPGFNDVATLLASHDVRFCNLETTVHRNEGYPSLFPGGGYAMADPEVLTSLKDFGFNALSVANNHTMDYCHKGLEATLGYLQEHALPYAGAGLNLAEAAAPTYIECSEGRVALIATTSSFHDSDAAGAQGGTIPGRPGVNPLRHKALYQLVPDLYEKVAEIGSATGMNDTLNWSAQNGYQAASENVKLRTIEFAQGAENKKLSSPLPKDMERIARSIHEAQTQADCIVVSVHSHQFKGTDEVPDDFIVEFCHNCIDEGAHVAFGHGSHVLRGIETYNGGVICYGLGDFILQNETVQKLPADFYDKYGMGPDLQDTVGLAMQCRSNNGTRGLSANKMAWESVLVSLSFDNGVKELTLYPLSLRYDEGETRRGWPVLAADNSEILERIAHLSEAFNTTITIEDNIGHVIL